MSPLVEAWLPDETPEPMFSRSTGPLGTPLLTPYNAWRILERRTGVNVCRSTFYRWVQCGRVFSLKIGGRIFVPWPELDEIIKQFRRGVRV